ncbi:MAG: DUF2202 domain-containing protein [Bacteroidetes bacterium]|nr:DUF2202 domain-containing protein [Bacteroidota bacterium]
MKQMIITAFTIAFLFSGCSEAQATGPSPDEMSGNGMDQELFLEKLATLDQEPLTAYVEEGLVFMREEEKLARDIYTAFAAKYNARVFKNITRSEQRHMDALKVLLDRYGIPDPVGTNAPGVFTDQKLQELYDALLAKGSVSLTEAYAVGKMIEEVDIADLDERSAGLDAGSDVAAVYAQLRRASENHLRAFTRMLGQ